MPAQRDASSHSTVDITLYHGTFIHSKSLSELEVADRALVGVDAQGIIRLVERNVASINAATLHKILEANGCANAEHEVITLQDKQFFMPGLIDTHAHAPQYVFMGTGMDLPLLDWLNTYTFPREAEFSSTEYAKSAYTKAVTRFLNNGSTMVSWYGTIHLEACKLLVDILYEKGQRGYVGKVNMDQNAPDYYIETTDESLKATLDFVEYALSKEGNIKQSTAGSAPRHVTPIITPRFAITCSSKLMSDLGSIAAQHNLPIQSHLSENLNEIEFTNKLHPGHGHYTGIYANHKLLNHQTIMAHCVHLSDDEIQMIKKAGAAVSHCPNSNFSLHSGVCDVRRLLDAGIKVGLGTDVAGGFKPSMLDAIRMTLMASKTRKIMAAAEGKGDAYRVLSMPEVVYLATLGGAQVVGQENTLGNFEVGKSFDALLVDLDAPETPVDLFPHDSTLSAFEKFLYNGDERNLAKVFVGGRCVAGYAQ